MGDTTRSDRGYRLRIAIGGILFVLLQGVMVPVVHAAGITVPTQNLSVLGNSTQYSAVDARGYEHLRLSFHYEGENLEIGDKLHYGWKSAGEEGVLGTVDGRAESADDPQTDSDETGDVSLLALPVSLANSQFQIFFQNTGTATGTSDQVDISLIQVDGDAMELVDTTPPTIPAASPVPGSYNTVKSVVLTSSDEGPGQVKIYYTTDGTTPDKTSQFYNAPIEITVSQTVKAIAYDVTGNASEVAVLMYVIDTTAPTIESVQYSNANTATNADVIVTITTSEAVNTPEGWEKETDTVFKKKYVDNTNDSVTVTDLAGNISEPQAIEIKGIDKVAPDILLSGVGENGVYAGSVSYETTDNSGVKLVTVNGVNASASGVLSQPGQYMIVVTDSAGNTFTEQLTIVILSPPVVGEAVARPPAALTPVAPASVSTAILPSKNASSAIATARSGSEKSIASVSDTSKAKTDDQNKDSDIVLAPSEQGWKLLGIAWYWFALLGGLVGAGWWFFKVRYRTGKDEF